MHVFSKEFQKLNCKKELRGDKCEGSKTAEVFFTFTGINPLDF